METSAFDQVAALLPDSLLKLMHVTFFNLRHTVLSPLLMILTMYFLYFLCLPLFFDVDEFKTRSLPVTSAIIDQIIKASDTATRFFIVVAAGLLVHRDRDTRFHEIMDSLPHSAVVIPTGRLLALMLSILILPFIGILTGILSQTTRDYWHLQIPVYLSALLGPVTWEYCCIAVAAMLVQTLAPGKITGYLLLICGASVSALMVPILDGGGLPVFGAFPQVVYSDFHGYAPWFRSLLTTGIWNLLLFGLFHTAVILLWKRGVDCAYLVRLTEIRHRLTGPLKPAAGALCVLTTGCILFLLLNQPAHQFSAEEHIAHAAQYEQLLRRRFEHLPHPVVTSAAYDIDLFPDRRAFKLKTDLTLENTDSEPQTTVILNTRRGFRTTVQIDRGYLLEDYPELMCSIYRLDPPLLKGERIHLRASVDYAPPAAELDISNKFVLPNGSFLSPDEFTLIGYRSAGELQGKTLRRTHNLEDRSAQQSLDPADQQARRRQLLDPYGRLTRFETVIGTAADQIAVAPGTLVNTWRQKDRQYFHYRMDPPSVHNPVILSAQFKVAREVWNGVDTEIYYHPDHAWNVPDMMLGMHRTLEYGSRNFSPYQFSFCRVLEFPRVHSDSLRGIAFPGVMPYSESSGFTSDLRDPASFNTAFYVVSHEVAHQWWGYQLLPADIEGGKVLLETLADYTAMMVFEQEFGAEFTRRFLEHRTNHYLSSRLAQEDSEPPLARSRIDQGHLFYSRGSLVMYHLRQLIGEDRINTALQNLLQKFGGGNPPYATSLDLLESLRQQTPIEHHQVLDELFNQITLFQNQTRSATAQKLPDNTWQVTLLVECRKIRSDGDGREQDIPFEQFVEVGAFSAPQGGRRFGEPLYQKLHLLKSGSNSITFKTQQRPETAGIDPFLILIDRTPKDNVVEVRTP